MEIKADTLTSSLTTDGEKTDVKWFEKLASPINKLASLPVSGVAAVVQGIKKLIPEVKKIGENVANIVKNLADWKALFNKGVKKIEEYKGAVIKFAKNPVGWIKGGIATVLALGTAAALNTIGVSPTNLVTTMLNFGEALWNFNFQYTDKELLSQIESMIEGLYGNAGDFMGKSLAQLIVGGTLTPPKVQINIRGLALCWLINPDIRSDMLQNVSMFAQQGITVVKQVLIRFALLKGRHALKEYWKNAPATVKKAVSGVWKDADKVITTWGDEGNKPWSMSSHVDEKVEKIEDKKLKNFTENFLESFWDGFRDSVEYVYN